MPVSRRPLAPNRPGAPLSHPPPSRPRRLPGLLFAGALAASLAVTGCDDEPIEPEQPIVEPLPEVVALTPDEPGHLAVEQRGIALDTEDISNITQTEGRAGVTADQLEQNFGLLVLNRPFVDWRITRCPRSVEAEPTMPRPTSEQIIERFADVGIEFDRVAVTVPLLTPGQRGLLYVCFDAGGDRQPRFDIVEHRERLIAAFVDLAGLPGIEYITVGAEMNRYYHLNDADGERLIDDYSNFMILYRDIYRAIKDANPDVAVGPGISWSMFYQRTMPELAGELGVDPSSLEAANAAYRRTVRPLLSEGRGADRVRTADFLGVTMIPFDAELPWGGEPSSDVPDRQTELYAVFEWLPLLVGAGTSDEIPLVMPVVDWAEQGAAAASKKGPFLATLKAATSVLDVEWLAWRRLSTLQDSVAEANQCAKYTNNEDPALEYPASYCESGMLDESGQRRSVWTELITAP